MIFYTLSFIWDRFPTIYYQGLLLFLFSSSVNFVSILEDISVSCHWLIFFLTSNLTRGWNLHWTTKGWEKLLESGLYWLRGESFIPLFVFTLPYSPYITECRRQRWYTEDSLQSKRILFSSRSESSMCRGE